MRIPRARTQKPGTKKATAKADRRPSRQSPDEQLLWTITIALFAAGAVMVYSASSGNAALAVGGDPMGYLKRYLIIGAAGLVIMRFASRIDLNRVRELTPILLMIAFGMLVLVLMPGFGVEVNGAKRWLGAGMLRFQPSEVMKIALVLYAAMLIAQNPKRVQSIGSLANPLFYVIAAACGLIMLQPDMGTDLVICSTLGLLLIAAGAQLKDLAKVGAVLGVLVLLMSILEPYRMARLTSFLHPDHDPTGAGYQSQQARIAIGSGGIFGVGLGESVQKIHYMPEAHTDMILAVIGEELGLMGIGVLATLYTGLIFVGLRAAKNSRDIYARLLAVGITSMLASQALLNFFAVLGMAPLTGVPLPFISYGGANLIIMLSAMGLLINVASGRHQARVRVIRGGGRSESHQRTKPHTQRKVAAAGGARTPSRPRGGHNENRRRSGGNGRSRRSGPGSR
ncbi:MAG: putative lipid II flippase FtsW [Thermoleophilaceae bacterium]|nr:putative lipid II flippase FtsW [Thermoleophilaceae bacterium]